MENLRGPKTSGEGSILVEDLMISYSKFANSTDSFSVGYKLSPIDGKTESIKLKVISSMMQEIMRLGQKDNKREHLEPKLQIRESVIGTTKQRHKDFEFIFDLESISYVRRFEKASDQPDMQSEQLQTYLHDILNTTRVGKEKDVPAENWEQGIRTLVLMHDGQVVDINDLEEDDGDQAIGGQGIKIEDANRAEELASVKSQEEKITRLIKDGVAISERGTERSLESYKVGDIKIRGLVDSIEDSRTQIKNLLLKRIGKGSLVIFFVMTIIYLVFSVTSYASFWMMVTSHFKNMLNKIQLSSSTSQLTTSITKSTLTLGLLSIMNTGVVIGIDSSRSSQNSYFNMLVSEYSYAIDQIDQASRALPAQIYQLADQNVIGDWSNDGTTNLTFTQPVSSSSLVNAYQILTSQNLELKSYDPKQFTFSDPKIKQMQRVVQQSLLPQSWILSEHTLNSYLSRLNQSKSALYISVIINFVVILLPTLVILVTLLRVGYRRNSVSKVYYYFSIDDVKDICRRIDEYLGLMKNRETGTVLSLSFALKETSQIGRDFTDAEDDNRSRGFKKLKNNHAQDSTGQEGLESVLVQKSIASKYATRLFRNMDVFFLCFGSCSTLALAVYMLYYCINLFNDSTYVLSMITGVYRYQQRTLTAISSFANTFFGPAKSAIGLASTLLSSKEDFLAKSKNELNPFLEMPSYLASTLSLFQGKFAQDICGLNLNVTHYWKQLCPTITPTLTQQGLLYSLLDLPFSQSQSLIYTGAFASVSDFSCPISGLSPPSAYADASIGSKFGCLLNNDTTIDVFNFGIVYSHRLYRMMWEQILSEYISLTDRENKKNLNTVILMILGIFLLLMVWMINFVRDELHFQNSLLMVFHVPSNTLKKNQRLQKILTSTTI